MAAKLSPEEAAALQKNFSNRLWRLENLYKIKTKQGTVETFKLNSAQKFMLNNMWYFTLILKTRQIGSTTFWVIFLLDQCLFIPNTKVGVIAHTQPDAQEILVDKVKFAFDNLPEAIMKSYMPLVTDRKDKLEFNNGSSIFVDCSMRSGTLQYLLVTEFGKLCAQFPDKAQEVVTGGFPTIAVGNYLIVESTAEGWEGYFYDYCQDAMKAALAHKKLSKQEFKFLFLGWYLDDGNVISNGDVTITKEDEEYFSLVEVEVAKLAEGGHILPIPGGKLSAEQKAWYVVTKGKLKEKTQQEMPGYPGEAFSNSAKAAYFCEEMVYIHKEKRIMSVPYERGFPVNTSWDFGTRGYMTIWFHQLVHGENRLIHYYENFGRDFSHYVGYMQKLGYSVWGTHFLPHDANTTRLLQSANSTYKAMLENLGLRNIVVVPRTGNKRLAREVAGNFLRTCYFDQENTAKGVLALENYRRLWNARAKEWRESEEESHGADSFICLSVGLEDNRSYSNQASEFLKTRSKPNALAFR